MACFTTSVTRRTALGGALLALLAGTVRPRAAAPDHRAGTARDLRYGVAAGGLKVADAALRVEPADGTGGSGGTVTTELVIQSRGLVQLVSGVYTEMVAVSRRLAGGGIGPQRFRAVHVKTDRTREIAIRYGEDGRIADLDLTNQGRPRESDVPDELQRGTVDPLTAFLRMCAWAPQAAAAETPATLVVPVFDGRKRFDLEATHLRRTRWAGPEGEMPALELKVRLLARFGFEPDDELMTSPDDPEGRWLRVLASDEPHPIPLRVETVERGKGSVIELTRDCSGADGSGEGCASLRR